MVVVLPCEMLNQVGFKLIVHQKDLIGDGKLYEVLLSTIDTTYNFPVDYSSKYTFTLQAYNTLDSISDPIDLQSLQLKLFRLHMRI